MIYETVREIFTKVNKCIIKTPNYKGLDEYEYIYRDAHTNANICTIALNNLLQPVQIDSLQNSSVSKKTSNVN